MPKVYVAGPMRGLPDLNFPAFDAASAMLREKGWTVISPAEMDRTHGIDEKTMVNPGVNGGEPAWIRVFIQRDVDVLINTLKAEEGDAIALLPGCRRSTGCTGESGLARWAKLKFISGITGEELKSLDPQAEVDEQGDHYMIDPLPTPHWVIRPNLFASCGCGYCD